MEYLECPQCGNAKLHQIVTGFYRKEEVNFFNEVRPLRGSVEVIYICPECSRAITEHDQVVEKLLVIVTGNSGGMQRVALQSIGVGDIQRSPIAISLEKNHYASYNNEKVLFITRKFWDSNPVELGYILQGKVTTVVDVSEMNYDEIRATLKPYA